MREWVFLSGPMGAGKTTLGRALAERLGARFVDLDARIEAAAGRTIASIFAADGEAAFRALEAREVLSLLDESPAVVALGGGAVVDRATRHRLLERGTLITLTAPGDVLEARLRSEGDAREARPLLDRVVELTAQRAAAYAECHAQIDTTGPIASVVDRLFSSLSATAAVVPLGRRSYRVGFGDRLDVVPIVEELAPTSVIVVSDTNVDPLYAAEIAERLGAPRVVLEPGEAHKELAAVDRIWTTALEAGIDRRALLVSVGGGVVGDLTGFAAATLLRGIRFVQVPTTLLAMVDASVGGKTGFDRPQGKNLIGAFHQPRHVQVDVRTLHTLEDAELASGFAEVVKSAWLDGEPAVRALERDVDALRRLDREALTAAVYRSVRFKARVVAQDEREAGRRQVLNFGHTVGHAIETAAGFGAIRHGEAVALGMIAAFRVASRLGDLQAPAHEARVRALLLRLGLPVDLASHWDEQTARLVAADKKRRGDFVHFVVPGAPGEVRVVPLPLDHEFGP